VHPVESINTKFYTKKLVPKDVWCIAIRIAEVLYHRSRQSRVRRLTTCCSIPKDYTISKFRRVAGSKCRVRQASNRSGGKHPDEKYEPNSHMIPLPIKPDIPRTRAFCEARIDPPGVLRNGRPRKRVPSRRSNQPVDRAEAGNALIGMPQGDLSGDGDHAGIVRITWP